MCETVTPTTRMRVAAARARVFKIDDQDPPKNILAFLLSEKSTDVLWRHGRDAIASPGLPYDNVTDKNSFLNAEIAPNRSGG
jgi:hypothetical protein